MHEKIRQMIKNIAPLLAQYDLGDFSNLAWADGGFTNENYIIETSKGKFFLKKYLRHSEEKISREHKLLEYLKENDFPVPELIKNNNNNALTSLQGGLYTFYNFISGHTRVQTNTTTSEETKNIAKILARYHHLAKNIPLDLEPLTPIVNRGSLLELYGKVLDILKDKQNTDEFDKEIKSIIHHKITELNSLPQINTSELPSLFVHGDFHAANMKFNEGGGVRAVFDWELAKYQPRVWEVLCAMVFCSKINWTWNFHTPLNFEKAKLFLENYHNLNPLTEKELEVIPNLLKLASADLSWPLNEHYIHKNFASDRFLPKHAEHWFFWDDERISNLKFILSRLPELQRQML